MKDNKVISRKNLPTNIPVLSTILILLALDYWNAPEWLCGVIITIWAIYIVGCIIVFCREIRIDLFEEKDNPKIPTEKRKSTFQEKMENMMDVQNYRENNK